MAVWGSMARRRNCYFHVGRFNSGKRIAMCTASGVNSFDGTSVTRLPRLDAALANTENQGGLFSFGSQHIAP